MSFLMEVVLFGALFLASMGIGVLGFMVNDYFDKDRP